LQFEDTPNDDVATDVLHFDLPEVVVSAPPFVSEVHEELPLDDQPLTSPVIDPIDLFAGGGLFTLGTAAPRLLASGRLFAPRLLASGSAGRVVPVVPRTVGQLHHVATDKAIKSGFTEAFQRIFAKAGMSLQHPANKVVLEGHAGRHAASYHQHVLQRLQASTDGLSGQAYTQALLAELGALRAELIRSPGLVKGIGLP
jgi:hypothetical protein